MRSSFICIHSLILFLSCANIIFAAPITQSGRDLSISKRSSNGSGVEEHDKSVYDPTIAARSTWTNAVNIQKRAKPAKKKTGTGAKSSKGKKATGGKNPKRKPAKKNKSKGTPKKKPQKTAKSGSGAGGPGNGVCPLGKKKSTGNSGIRNKASAPGQSKQSKKQTKKQKGTKKPIGRRGLQFRKRAETSGGGGVNIAEPSQVGSSCSQSPEEILKGPDCIDVDMNKMEIQDLNGTKYIGTSGLNICTGVVIKSDSAAIVAHVTLGTPSPDQVAEKVHGSAAKFPTTEIKVFLYGPEDCDDEIDDMKESLPELLGIDSTAITTKVYAATNTDDIPEDQQTKGKMLLVTPNGTIVLGDRWEDAEVIVL